MTLASTDTDQDHLRFPVGRFTAPTASTPDDRARWIAELAALPAQLRAAVDAIGERRLDTPYRPGGWTARQVVHHVADSHMHAFLRVKHALAEQAPTITPYDEAVWSELPDVPLTPVSVSLALLEALHERWVVLLRALEPAAWARTYVHPEHPRPFTVEHATAMYAWHSRHHLGHLHAVRDA
jgi:hypothetical protein